MIKKVNREEINAKKANATVIKPVVNVEEEIEEVMEDEVEEEVVEDEVEEEIEEVVEDEVEEEIEEVKTVTKPVAKKKTTVPVNTKKTTTKKTSAKQEKVSNKKAFGSKKPKKEVTTERTIGTVYPKDLLMSDIQALLSEEFDISLADTRKVFNAVEKAVYDACQVASIRMFGGIISSQHRRASVNKAPKVDYASYTGERDVITITGVEIGQPEKYRGDLSSDRKTFTVTEMYNYETGEWEEAEGTIDMTE